MSWGFKKLAHRSHCNGWYYMTKVNDKYVDILKLDEKRLKKKYSTKYKKKIKTYEPKDLFNNG